MAPQTPFIRSRSRTASTRSAPLASRRSPSVSSRSSSAVAPSVHEERLPSRRRLLVEALAQAVAQERHERRHVARRADDRGIEGFHERAGRRVGVSSA